MNVLATDAPYKLRNNQCDDSQRLRKSLKNLQSRNLKTAIKKIKNFRELGAQVGISIDPDEETVIVYCPEGEPIVLGNEDILTVTELFPVWDLQISEL